MKLDSSSAACQCDLFSLGEAKINLETEGPAAR